MIGSHQLPRYTAARGVAMDYREKVQQLQREIKQLYEANDAYRRKHSHSPLEKHAQDMRGQRLQQIMDELRQIANRKNPQEGRLGEESRTGISKGFPTMRS